ncbi:hypothetical protein A2866_06265 [Candidatus Roizmanbacteria bacterium RIFCSPHIGHO2_01_FULL_39_8]|nr:MAG: hypothetical protein A2866_06265 [Candidatus Roizmanbacteria bacterium RIFCSPHIGHO2_01_FULL_39_8]OGK25945.1 MAG: hypothetical protein A3C28_06435 [Candidatus Roizmanbacteria bacterium RIFCSPHIGHO2_02_FULL_39_9]
MLSKTVGYISSIPGRLKGMKFGKNSYIAPGYDWFNVDLKGVVIGNNVVIGRNAWIQTIGKIDPVNDIKRKKPGQFNTNIKTESADTGGKIIIGDNTQIGRYTNISAVRKITIGTNCLIAYNVTIADHDHHFTAKKTPMESGVGTPKEITIGDECFIGAHSFILKGVRLGKHCVVGANSVVTKSFSPNSVLAGNPARLIRKLK